ncbi:unnamed protein product [Pieris brassicae]|uniref:Uncharacterized protein n=1 Tax=Pieris brassicae TaxID=7116 RepID=A0A9P0TNV1_PIEBR|nr:unnamed protein product [Pieris brassicae]
MYNNQEGLEEDLKVKKGYFRKIFDNNYNLGFGSPRTDVCSVCLQLFEKIKRASDETEKQRLQGSSKAPLTRENVFAYCWTEDEYDKGANEIASVLWHRLGNTDFTGIRTVRLIADGCPGQNKNCIMLTMCSKWLLTSAPNDVQEIQIVFPVVLSYLQTEYLLM